MSRLLYADLPPAYKEHLRDACRTAPPKRPASRVLFYLDTAMFLASLLYVLVLALSQVNPPLAWARALIEAMRFPLAVVYTADVALRVVVLGPCLRGAPAGSSAKGGCRDVLLAALSWAPDVLIVVVGWLEYAPSVVASGSSAGRLGGLRILRLLGPLGRIPALSMRPLYLTIAGSLVGLLEVLSLFALAQFSFGLVAVQLWRGLLQGVCGYVDPVSGALLIPGLDEALPQYLSATTCALGAAAYPGDSSGAVQALGDACAPIVIASGALVQQTCVAGDTGSETYANIYSSMLMGLTISTVRWG